MNLYNRLKEPTPKFFKKLRNLGFGLTAIGGAIVTVPVLMPTVVITIGGYLMVAGTVATVVSQMVIKDLNENDDDDTPNIDGRVIQLNSNPLLDADR